MASDVDVGIQLIQLKNKIAKHFGQSEWLELGTLVNQFELVNSHTRLLRSLSFGDPDYEGNVLTVLRGMVDADPNNLGKMVAFVQAVTPDEEGQNVSSEESAGRKIVFVPTVFSVPDGDVENDLVSVMMPFNTALSSVFTTIKDAATDAGMRCQRGDDIWDHSTVIQDLFNLIFKSYIVVCDFTGKNPNVFYEAGIAHTLGKHVIPLTQSADDIPFDLQHHRYLKYLNNTEGRATLRTQLSERIKTLASKRPTKHPWQK